VNAQPISTTPALKRINQADDLQSKARTGWLVSLNIRSSQATHIGRVILFHLSRRLA
jgi:hypothetical protein